MPTVLRVPVSRTAVTRFAAWAVALLRVSEPYTISSVNFIKDRVRTDNGGRHSSFLRKNRGQLILRAHITH